MRLGFGEILVILVIALLVFGPTKLPQLGDALGKGIRNFKRAQEGMDEDERRAEQARLVAGRQVSAPQSVAEAKKA
jgi:sec-independent protein translocase protein TatA